MAVETERGRERDRQTDKEESTQRRETDGERDRERERERRRRRKRRKEKANLCDKAFNKFTCNCNIASTSENNAFICSFAMIGGSKRDSGFINTWNERVNKKRRGRGRGE